MEEEIKLLYDTYHFIKENIDADKMETLVDGVRDHSFTFDEFKLFANPEFDIAQMNTIYYAIIDVTDDIDFLKVIANPKYPDTVMDYLLDTYQLCENNDTIKNILKYKDLAESVSYYYYRNRNNISPEIFYDFYEMLDEYKDNELLLKYINKEYSCVKNIMIIGAVHLKFEFIDTEKLILSIINKNTDDEIGALLDEACEVEGIFEMYDDIDEAEAKQLLRKVY